HPNTATTSESMTQKPVPAPKVCREAAMLRAPKCWPTLTVVAIEKPNTAENSRNMITLALAVAASALSPISRPTQTALTEPLRVWSMFERRVGIENTSRVRRIGPWVRSPCSGRGDAAPGWSVVSAGEEEGEDEAGAGKFISVKMGHDRPPPSGGAGRARP